METAPPPFSAFPSSPSTNIHHSTKSKDVQTHHLVLGMRGNLTLKRLSANSIALNKFQDPRRFFCVRAQKVMAEEASKSTEKIKKQREEEEDQSSKKLPPPPPPPEKPLPGDCCGSGCVRCVWDVYYEELEDYNKICENYKSKSKAS